MIKISSQIKDELEEKSDFEEVARKEEEALQQKYVKALDLKRKGNLKDAKQLLEDLLGTDLAFGVQKPRPGEKEVTTLYKILIKYLCHKLLASMLTSVDDIDTAFQSYLYCEASELDDTDATLWHQFGERCMHAKRYYMALYAFQRGAVRDSQHWPCIDKIITLLLGLDFKEKCISTIYETLQLNPYYLRGLAYRKHIYTFYPYVRDFMKFLNPMYGWDEKEGEPIDKEKSDKLIIEASEIHKIFIEQQKDDWLKCELLDLKLKKPINKLTWQSVGDYLVNMHNYYMIINFSCHAYVIELVFKSEPLDVEVESVELVQKSVKDNDRETEENNKSIEKADNELVNEYNTFDKDKSVADTEKQDSDVEMVPSETVTEQRVENDGKVSDTQSELKKKTVVRRQGSDLSFLKQWEWCNKRRSVRKKPVNRQDHLGDNIYNTLRRMVPHRLSPNIVLKKENQVIEASLNTRNLVKDLEEKPHLEPVGKLNEEYFSTENEQRDVKHFINKYNETKRDIIDMLKEYLLTLAEKWRVKWPEGLPETFIEANKCYNRHIDVPTCKNENREELFHYATVNILVEEFSINNKLNSTSEEKEFHELSVVDAIGATLHLKSNIFTDAERLQLKLRQLWAKVNIHIINKNEDFASYCLYQLSCEFEAMEEQRDTYNLELVNFTSKPIINKAEVLANIKFLKRNEKLSTVMDMYDRGHYKEVLAIVTDSFELCKTMARKQEKDMSLDFAEQLCLILNTYWALDDMDNCFKWSLVCLHEALKHYFRYSSGSPEYEKWTLTTVKIICYVECIITNEGLLCLDSISPNGLSQCLEDLIGIIGHQIETNVSEMPFGTVVPWILMHFILQREEDQEVRIGNDKASDEVPNPLLVLFIAHEQLGVRGWCCKSELLYFILDTIVPRLRSPALSKCFEQVCQYMEQCVYCLFYHPAKKTKLKYLVDHNATPRELNWERAQQIYEIFKPLDLPELEGKISGISSETETLFQRILTLLPSEYDPQKYIAGVKNYIKGTEDKLPNMPHLLPFKMRDIYFLLGDYHFKKENGKLAVKYNILDVIVNNDRFKSWAQISLSKSLHLERILQSCKNLNNIREFLNPAKSVIRCFERALQLDPSHCTMWIEYGMFVYTIHSFCSRLLKQASESLSMEDFASLEKQKEDMLDTTQKCFATVLNDIDRGYDGEKANEDSWLQYYMLGKVAEKRNNPPSVYLDYYMKGVKILQEVEATYPLKINYSSPQHLSIEVLELHYRVHASILKYIEQHENKPIPNSVGKVFLACIEEWKNGPFTKILKKDVTDFESESSVFSLSEFGINSVSGNNSDSLANSNDACPLSEGKIMKITADCLNALIDCASRFSVHFKAIYRVAHYHFYYKKGKDIERCRDLMLSTFTSKSGQKLAGLFSERKPSNFINNIWKIPHQEVDRTGSFAFHMCRAVLLTIEILKEIDDHKTLLDLSLQLQKNPEAENKYLRDSDREELSQQAFSLCVQSLKGQLTKFSQQPDLKSNNIEQQALKSLMLDIYIAYQRVQKQPNSKQFTNLLIEGYKLITNDPISESMSHQHFVDQSMKFCQKHNQQLKKEAMLAYERDKSQTKKKQVAEQPMDISKPSTSAINPTLKPLPDTQSTSTFTSIPASSHVLPKKLEASAAALSRKHPMVHRPPASKKIKRA